MNNRHLAMSSVMCVSLVISVGAAGDDRRLIQAAKDQDHKAVLALLKQGIDVNATQPDGATALHWAAYSNVDRTADLLIRAGADVNAKNELGATPLWLAANEGNAGMIERLLKAGADPNVALSGGETPLMSAARTGMTDAVRLLLVHGANVNAAERARGQTALMWAAARAHDDVVRVLLEVGADVHARSNVRHRWVNTGRASEVGDTDGTPVEEARGGFTPLLFAARNGHIEAAKVLIAAGREHRRGRPERRQPARDGDAQRPERARSRSPRTRRGPERSWRRVCCVARSDTQGRSGPVGQTSFVWRRSECPTPTGHLAQAVERRLGLRGCLHQLDADVAGREVLGPRDDEGPRGGWGGSAPCSERWHDTVDSGDSRGPGEGDQQQAAIHRRGDQACHSARGRRCHPRRDGQHRDALRGCSLTDRACPGTGRQRRAGERDEQAGTHTARVSESATSQRDRGASRQWSHSAHGRSPSQTGRA